MAIRRWKSQSRPALVPVQAGVVALGVGFGPGEVAEERAAVLVADLVEVAPAVLVRLAGLLLAALVGRLVVGAAAVGVAAPLAALVSGEFAAVVDLAVQPTVIRATLAARATNTRLCGNTP